MIFQSKRKLNEIINQMKKLFKTAFLALFIAVTPLSFYSCSDSDDDTGTTVDGTGVTAQSWNDIYQTSNEGETANFTFTASGSWSARSNTTWCTVSPASGGKGAAAISVTIAPNTTGTDRSAIIYISVANQKDRARLQIKQGSGNSGSGTYTDVCRWMFEYMNKYYLWNEPLATFTPDYSISYDAFLTKMLDHVDADNHRNRDDGHWANGEREYYYSFIDSDAPTSRSAGDTETGSGIMYMEAGYVDNIVALLPALVAPGSPAAQAGLKRGDIITKIDGSRITESNYNTMANRLYAGNVNVTTYDYDSKTENSAVRVDKATFVDPAIYQSSVLTVNSGKKVGYIAYMGFHMNYDSQLIDIFSQFKNQGVTDLILDLRYNGGGHVLSSVVLGTLIAGNDKKDQIYSRTTYNAARTAKGEIGEYKIGNATTPERTYSKITDALSASLGLKTIYVIGSENTASASELIINGLRGLDLTVNLIGTTTNGKNVGMEAMTKQFGNYSFQFAPITFYSQNAKGFKDYSNGFTPDLVFDDSEYFFGDFGTTDDILTHLALQWINNGVKPTIDTSRASSLDHAARKLSIRANKARTPARKTHGMIAFPENTDF